MVFWLKGFFPVGSAKSKDQDLCIALYFLLRIMKWRGVKAVTGSGTTHMIPNRGWDYPMFPAWAHFISPHEKQISFWYWQKFPERFELCMCHLPVEGHWSHQCHTQTGRNPARQWRQWKPRSRWPVGNETQGWETAGKFSSPSPIPPQLGLLMGPTVWFSYPDTHSEPYAPRRLIYTRMGEPFITSLTLLKLKRVPHFFQGRNQNVCVCVCACVNRVQHKHPFLLQNLSL